ncbi:helix-turn-helix domain-containing protein [Phyllobacterium phragmitis]|uniref:helix-turn-helix domain-containing protein n=1 Tax=Phyllobacterium phragmitis TaxID=2670329 RepID=UPI0011B26987|nr:helix-turn-helix domain-containing protein [Phyllobacterium phragmitis]
MTNSTASRAWTWRHAIVGSDLPSTTRHVLLTISCFMNDVGEGCYPTTKQLAEATGLSERAICTHIQIACEAGWIRVSQHGFRGQKWRNNEYHAVWPDREKGTEPDSVASEKALNVLPKGTEPNDRKALNDVQSNSPVNNPIKDSLSETSSDHAPKRKKNRISYPEAFDALWHDYPTHANMSKKEAFDAWRKLDDDDRPQVHAAVPGYKSFLSRKPDTEVIHLCRFISKRRFDGFASALAAQAPMKETSEDQWNKRLRYARQQQVWSTESLGGRCQRIQAARFLLTFSKPKTVLAGRNGRQNDVGGELFDEGWRPQPCQFLNEERARPMTSSTRGVLGSRL